MPTTLVYNANGTLSSWGFMCADDELEAGVPGGGKVRYEFFKIFMDADTLADAQQQGLTSAPQSVFEAQQFVTEFLRQVYAHIKESIKTQIGRRGVGSGWADLAVEFLFSVPTTWTSQNIVNSFKKVIREAGFGIEGPRHSAQVNLTEAEAAAVVTLKTSAVSFGMGSVFLIVDAGGGTTDLALMQVTSSNMAIPQMASLHAVNGVGIGATLIDRLFMRLVSQRSDACLDAAAHIPPGLPLRLARSHQFRTMKHKLGERAYMQPLFRIPIEGLSFNFSHAGLGIENGKMVFTLETVKRCNRCLTRRLRVS